MVQALIPTFEANPSLLALIKSFSVTSYDSAQMVKDLEKICYEGKKFEAVMVDLGCTERKSRESGIRLLETAPVEEAELVEQELKEDLE